MAEKKSYANDPLLYIHQANSSNAQAPMQHSYMSSRKKAKQDKINSADEEVVTAPRKVNKRKSSFQKEIEREEPQNDKDQEEVPKRKNFKEMDIPEKIDYFINRPDFAPQVKCEIKTSEKSYRGIVTGFEENYVFLKPTNRKTPVQIGMDDIKDVQLLGF
ncbi:CotO family spore coat protein [Oceanobacillus rekensis]|uniref:CotO family spore coat protein n=1 Tax=Oceanobacillus rekensis TaxID=937927 RepID=UPI000B441827|nr:CotO family spore coat protein [Oceanobacillus rekensis]